ncbi:MAG TPA: efflux RND transporter periplasmic adaptor subunit [Thermoanaerobaculia bacterium]|nr:efflux RND transporter periplasmic adaptor subunit [Thermoanaerobaculia bacterium]HQR66826.1 efflux RND transporter periplasmic adaptor subunit [Thermoanaerobaculia bacterium]
MVSVTALSTVLAGGAGAAPRPADPPLTAAATLMVDQEVTVTTRVDGVIDGLLVDRGDLVQKGQALSTVDQREFKLDLRAAQETLNVSRTDFKRYDELFRQNLCSQAELEQKRSRYELAQVEFERAQLVIDRSVSRAPFDGIVADRYVRLGEKVLVEENKPLFKVVALEPLLARAYVPGASLLKVKVGQDVTVVSKELPEGRSTGKVSFVSPILDPGSGSVQVVVRVKRDPGKLLRPGMAVQLQFAAAP